jgi:hypothetical protein
LWKTCLRVDNALRVVLEGLKPSDWSSSRGYEQDFRVLRGPSVHSLRVKPGGEPVESAWTAVDNTGSAGGASARTLVPQPNFRRMGYEVAAGYGGPRAAGWPRLVNARGEPRALPLGKRAPRRPSGEARLPESTDTTRTRSTVDTIAGRPVALCPYPTARTQTAEQFARSGLGARERGS